MDDWTSGPVSLRLRDERPSTLEDHHDPVSLPLRGAEGLLDVTRRSRDEWGFTTDQGCARISSALSAFFMRATAQPPNTAITSEEPVSF